MELKPLATIDPDLQVLRLMQTVTDLRKELTTERESAFRIFRQQEATIASQAAEIERLRRVMRDEVEPLAREVLAYCAQWKRQQQHGFGGG